LFDLPEGRAALRLFRVPRHRSCGGYGPDERPADRQGMGRRLRPMPGPARHAKAGRMVGQHGRSVPHGVAGVAKIERVEVLMVGLTPKGKRTDAIQAFVSQETPFVRIFADDGAVGTGYTYTIGTGGHAIVELLA